MKTDKIGFIGLGVMGSPMAGHLSKKNFQVSVFNRTHKKSVIWHSKYKGKICSSLSDIANSSNVIILCVGNDKDVKAVY